MLNAVLPGRTGSAVASIVSSWAEALISVVSLARDLSETFARQATAGFIPATVVVMVIGGVLIVVSLYYNRISALVGRFMPGPGA